MAIENGKILNVRIKNKYDSYENWAASGLVLEPGEIAIAYTTVDVKVDNGTAKHPALLMKVGDGEKTFANLPWLSAKAADVLSVCKNETDLKEFVNGVIADAGIASDEAMEALAGRVTIVEQDLNGVEGVAGLKEKVATAENAIDALELLVGNEAVGAQITAAITALNLGATYETIVEADKVRERVAALEGMFGDGEGTVEAQIATAVAAEAEIARAAEKANADAIKAIQDDYLVEADKTELQGNIDTLANGAVKANTDAIATLNGNSSVEGSVDKKVADAINTFATQISDDGTVNTYKELINYAATHGAEFTELVGEVDANTGAIATLNGDASTAGSVAKKIADAIAAENLSQYATDGELSAVAGRVTTLEGEMDTAQADIDALEEKVGEKSVATQISEAIATENLDQYATDEDLAALAGIVGKEAEGEVAATGLVGKVATLEGKMTAAEGQITDAEADITALQQTRVETVTAAAGSGLKATRTDNNVVIDFDEAVTLVFDCGGADVTTA